MTFKEQYILNIRNYMKDFAEKNELLQTVESTDERISQAIDDIYNHVIFSPPVKLVMSLEEVTKLLWFKYGVIAELLESEVLLNIRNALPYQDSGTQVDENYKAGPYANMVSNFRSKFDTELSKLKVKFNLENFNWNGTDFYENWASYYPLNRPII